MEIIDEIQEGCILMDGAMGTLLQSRGLPPHTPSDLWNIERPDEVLKVHREYSEAGSRMILTNTFCGNKDSIKKGIELALSARNQAGAMNSAPTNRAVFVAGDLGPGNHDESILKIFADSQIDLMVFETMTNLKEMEKLITTMRYLKKLLPLMVMMTLDREGNLLSGETLNQAGALLEEKGIDIIGLNCGFGPEHLYPYFLKLKKMTKSFLAIKPNSRESVNPEIFAEWMRKYVDAGANLIGGCCGTTPQHIQRAANTFINRSR